MSTLSWVPVRSVEATHFVDALATGVASPIYNLPVSTPAVRRWFIKAISVIGVQQLALEFAFFSSAVGINGDPALDRWEAFWGFAGADFKQTGGAGVWRAYVDGLSIPYVDADSLNKVALPALHVALINRDPVAKLAAAAGQLQATFWLEPTGVQW